MATTTAGIPSTNEPQQLNTNGKVIYFFLSILTTYILNKNKQKTYMEKKKENSKVMRTFGF